MRCLLSRTRSRQFRKTVKLNVQSISQFLLFFLLFIKWSRKILVVRIWKKNHVLRQTKLEVRRPINIGIRHAWDVPHLKQIIMTWEICSIIQTLQHLIIQHFFLPCLRGCHWSNRYCQRSSKKLMWSNKTPKAFLSYIIIILSTK